jgi:ketosteroid isomerase-like protein
MTTEEICNIIKDISTKFVSAVQAQNIAGITQIYTDKPKFLPRGGDIPQFGQVPDNRWSIEYISQYWSDIFQIVGNSFKYVQYIKDVEVLGDAAYEIGVYIFAAETGVGEDLEEGTYFILWKKEDDLWKIAVHILNTTSNPKWR